jgi:hypothetical protein
MMFKSGTLRAPEDRAEIAASEVVDVAGGEQEETVAAAMSSGFEVVVRRSRRRKRMCKMRLLWENTL